MLFLLLFIFIVSTNSATDFEHAFDFESFFPKTCENLNIEIECRSCNTSIQSYTLLRKDGVSKTYNYPPSIADYTTETSTDSITEVVTAPSTIPGLIATTDPGLTTPKNNKHEAGAQKDRQKIVRTSAANVALVVFVCLCAAVGVFILANVIAQKISDHLQSGTYQIPGQTNAPI